jgi:glycosyltransferase involved in cell wall biosynthesis
MSRPVVCQLVHGFPIGGTEVLVDRLIRRLADRFDFLIACLDDIGELGEKLVADGFELHQLGRRPGFDWGCVRRLARLLDERGASVLHAHQYTPYAYGAATRLFGRRPSILFTEHGRFYPDVASRKRRWFNRFMMSRRDRLVAVGGAVRQALIANEGMPAQRIEIVYNGVSPSPAALSAAERAATRDQLGAAADEFLILQVARLDPIKDHGTALRAFALAAESVSRLRLVLVGDGPERGAIEQAIAAHRLGDRVTMLGQRRDVPTLLAAADAFLLTSVSEGIPVTIIEAMRAGLPVASTNVGGVPEVIEHGDTGWLAPAGDAEQLAAGLVRLATDASLRIQFAERGARRVAERFSESQMMGSYERIYGELLEAASAGSGSRRRRAASASAVGVAGPRSSQGPILGS